jgi:farnesyl-diphosphate farnesyltransferase
MSSRDKELARTLLGPILRSVSRSFYLTIRLLPRRLRKPVGLAYLLARATDSVADTAEVPALVRAETLSELLSIIEGQASPERMVEVAQSFAPLQTNQAEQRLVEALPDSLQNLYRLEASDQKDIVVLLGKIIKGQALDVARFGDATQVRALTTDRELHEYTYLVAGCVGEFWTELCFRHVRDFSKQSKAEMIELAKRYGAGLQLINILRDAHADLQAGRCYFPKEELDAIGIEPSQILLEPDRIDLVYDKWLEEAQRDLNAGMNYIHAIRNRRVRGATALPALIGARTLTLLRAAGPAALHHKVKVSRNEVRGILASVVFTLASGPHIEKMFRRMFD